MIDALIGHIRITVILVDQPFEEAADQCGGVHGRLAVLGLDGVLVNGLVVVQSTVERIG